MLTDAIAEWLEKEGKQHTSVLEIVKQCLDGELQQLTQRQLEIKIGRTLKELGWIKQHTEKGNKWIKPEQ